MSNEAKFTKGEWFIEKGANWSDNCWAISVKRYYDDSAHHCFAEVVYKMEHEDSNPELEANAHLIAAASEMYDLLNSIENDSNQVPAWLYDKIQKTLAKARGEHDIN